MKFGLIGCGAIGTSRAESLIKTSGAELKMVYDNLKTRREDFARRFNVVASETYEEMIADTDIDAIIVSTPPNLHREHSEAALIAGKHVLCEKPLASTIEDCKSIVNTAKKCHRTLGTGFNYRFYPAVLKARELLTDGSIGNVTSVKSFAGHPGGKEFTHHWVHDPAIMGGGALMDNGIHLADLMLYFLGKPNEMHGFASDSVWGFGASEDNGFVLARTVDGRIGSLHASWSEWSGYYFKVEVHGTLGAIHVSYPPMMTVLYRRPEGVAKKGKRKVFLFPGFQIKERLRSYRWTIEQSFIAEHMDFMKRINGDGSGNGASGDDGLRAVELVNSAYSSVGHAAIDYVRQETATGSSEQL